MNALRELPQDDRDIRVGAIFTMPDVSQLPEQFILEDTWIADQKDSDFCSAFSTVRASMLQEGVKLSPELSFALSKVISGDVDEFGQDLRTACQVHTKFGALENAPYSLENRSHEELRRIENWGNLESILHDCAVHKKASYASAGVTFDQIRASIYRFRNEKRAVVFGTIWDDRWTVDQKYMQNVPTSGGGHAMTIIGWDGDYMIVKNQYGRAEPHYFHRDIIDVMTKKFGAFMFVDISPEQAKLYQEKGYKADGNVLRLVLVRLMEALRKLLQGNVGAVPSKWLLPALCWQESDGIADAVGDKHLVNHAYGILQIRKPYMKDVYKWRNAEDCLNNVSLSIDVFNKYMARYATEKRLKRPVTDQDIARIHNGGPNGHNNPKTLVYWYQVKKKMEMLENGTAPKIIVDRLKAHSIM